MVVLDLKAPPRPLARLVPWLLPLVRPFAVSARLLEQRPWERIWGAMFRELEDVRIDERYGGIVYTTVGRNPRDAVSTARSA